eukprot:TRINITY_DN2248_c0_g1_i3.p1 TRINITY_DN2248_c0_g1~~TRINITY_DN2248_c0_g1_i3.p1  ORF type:complete len:172 (+),score=54.69 TRINITY_DN2248_c0_g1_i3:95-610(+)
MSGDPFTKIHRHPADEIRRSSLPVLLHSDAVCSSKLLLDLIRQHLPGEEKRLLLLCASFDCMSLMEIQAKLDERLNMVVLEWPSVAIPERAQEAAAFLGSTVISSSYAEAGSPFGHADSFHLGDSNLVTLVLGDNSFIIDDAKEVQVVHSTEDDEENPEEMAAREAAEAMQ